MVYYGYSGNATLPLLPRPPRLVYPLRAGKEQ